MQETRPIPIWAYALVTGFMAGVHLAWWFFGQPPVTEGILADGDSYARLVRVEHLLETNAWFDSTFPGSNAPFTDTFHWTRPFDVLLIGLASPMLLFLDLKQALFWSGILISPVIHILLAIALAWAVRPILGVAGACAAGVLTGLQIGLMSFAAAGRADHHMLFLLLVALSLGVLIRAVRDTENSQQKAAWSSVPLAAGIWVGPETLLYIVLCQAVLGLGWLVRGGREWRRVNLIFSSALTVTVAIAILLERGFSGYTVVEFDRVSIVHLLFVGLLTVYWGLVISLGAALNRSPVLRVIAAIVGGGIFAGVLESVFPGFLSGGFAAIEPEMLVYLKLTNEYQSVTDLPNLLAIFGAAVLAVPWALWKTWSERSSSGIWAWVLVTVPLVIYVGFGLTWGRWSLYAGLFMAIAVAGLASTVESAVKARWEGAVRTAILVPAVFLIVAGPVGAGVLAVEDKEKQDTKPTCRIKDVADFLSAPPLGKESRIVLASPNYGPELIYRTPHRAVGSLLHRNKDGMLDTVGILGGSDETKITDLIRQRGIELILVCGDGGSNAYLSLSGAKDTLYKHLLRAQAPSWLENVALPVESGFHLYRVKGI